MKTIDQVKQHLKELKNMGKGFTPGSELFFNKDSKRLTIHGFIVANMMWEGLEGEIPLRSKTIYKEYECDDNHIDQAITLLDKHSDLVYFIDSPYAGHFDGGNLILKCFGDIQTFEKLLKLTNGSFIESVKKVSKGK